jgi:hypothetical protein
LLAEKRQLAAPTQHHRHPRMHARGVDSLDALPDCVDALGGHADGLGIDLGRGVTSDDFGNVSGHVGRIVYQAPESARDVSDEGQQALLPCLFVGVA